MVRKTLYAGGGTEKCLTWGGGGGGIDIIKSELADIPVLRLNIRSSSGLVDESGSRLDIIIRPGLASASVLRLGVIVNAARR